MRPRAVSCCLVLAGALLIAPRAGPAQAAHDRSTAVPSAARYFSLVRPRFSGDRARETVAVLDRYFRFPGNTGFDASIDHVAAALRDAGYVEQSRAAPTDRLTYRIERRPMDRPAWEPIDASLTIEGAADPAPILQWKTNRNMLAIDSYSTNPAGVSARLISVGKGTADEFDRTSVAGAIVFGEMPVGRLFDEAVRKRGAIGVLAYNLPPYTHPTEHRNSIQFSRIPLDSARRSWGILVSYAAREAILAAIAQGGGSARAHVVVASRFIAPAVERTLIADVRGRARADERYVVSAHVQEPGANDNASGVGTTTEMARVLAGLMRERAVDPQRTITFIWGNEISAPERYLADPARRKGVLWGLSLDMVGEDTQRTGGTFLIEKMPDPSAIWTRGDDKHTEWGGGDPLTADKLTPHFYNDFILQRCLDQAAVTGWIVRTNPFEGGSDHVPFLAAKKPGLLLWHFTDVYYHTDGDRLENVSARTMANVGISALVSVLTLVTADGATAQAIIAELAEAAERRLNQEAALSRAAMASGGDSEKESTILRAWTDWYRGAIRTTAEIEVGGASAETRIAIRDSESRVAQLGDSLVRTLGR